MAIPVSIYVSANCRPHASTNLLLAGVKKWCASSGRAQADFSLVRPEYGKPYFENAPDIQFSVTHSGDFWLCAISTQPVGLDLQQTQPVSTLKIARRFFHPNEVEYLEAHPDAFFAVWAAKESFVKLTGRGIDDDFSSFSVVSGGRIGQALDGTQFRLLPFSPGYTLCLCCRFSAAITITEITEIPNSPV
ncbi:MAG: 4'-phosphopantetheinyl transferase superfamily protein [Oscillospiraceae bacterium]|jgi:4'-phosphopantetheinyl transferase|nr:4'-phosphopantetheinyl transferase superfamily protein [Oscillospiraceae bacterium]